MISPLRFYFLVLSVSCCCAAQLASNASSPLQGTSDNSDSVGRLLLIVVCASVLVLSFAIALRRECFHGNKYTVDGHERTRWVDPTPFYAHKRKEKEETDDAHMAHIWQWMGSDSEEEAEARWCGVTPVRQRTNDLRTRLLVSKMSHHSPEEESQEESKAARRALALHDEFCSMTPRPAKLKVTPDQWFEVMCRVSEVPLNWDILARQLHLKEESVHGDCIAFATFTSMPSAGCLLTKAGNTELINRPDIDDAEATLRKEYERCLAAVREAEYAQEMWRREWESLSYDVQQQWQPKEISQEQGDEDDDDAPLTPRSQKIKEKQLAEEMTATGALGGKTPAQLKKELMMRMKNESEQLQLQLARERIPQVEEGAASTRETVMMLVEQSFERNHIGERGVTSDEELLKLSIDMAWRLQLQVDPDAIIEAIGGTETLFIDNPNWDTRLFETWFRLRIYEPSLAEPDEPAASFDEAVEPSSTIDTAVIPELEEHLSRLFQRYDLDATGTVNTFDELSQLTTNLCWALKLKVSHDVLQAKIKGVGEVRDDNAMSEEEYKMWFKAEFSNSFESPEVEMT